MATIKPPVQQAQQLTFSKSTLREYQVREYLVRALSELQDPMEVISLLAKGLFSTEDIDGIVLSRRISKEVDEFFSNINDTWLEESFDDGGEYRINISTSDINVIHSKQKDIRQFSEYLADKYRKNIDVNISYYITIYPSSEDELPTEKPDMPTNLKQFEVEMSN